MQLARVTPRGKPLVKHNLHWQMRYAFGQIEAYCQFCFCVDGLGLGNV